MVSPEELVRDFVEVSRLAHTSLREADIKVERLDAPHGAVNLLPGKTAVYVSYVATSA